MPSVVSRIAARGVAAVVLLLFAAPASAQDARAVLDTLRDPAAVAKVREALAADAVGSRARVDSFGLAGNAVAVAGVMLVPGAEADDFAAAERAVRAKVVAAVQRVAGAKAFNEFDLAGIKPVRGEALPHLQLQHAANAAAADELMLTGSAFDANACGTISFVTRSRSSRATGCVPIATPART